MGVVVGFDVGKALGVGIGVGAEGAVLEHLGRAGADEGLGPGVVIGIGARGHALAQAGLAQELPERAAAVLAAPVAVEEIRPGRARRDPKACWRAATTDPAQSQSGTGSPERGSVADQPRRVLRTQPRTGSEPDSSGHTTNSGKPRGRARPGCDSKWVNWFSARLSGRPAVGRARRSAARRGPVRTRQRRAADRRALPTLLASPTFNHTRSSRSPALFPCAPRNPGRSFATRHPRRAIAISIIPKTTCETHHPPRCETDWRLVRGTGHRTYASHHRRGFAAG